MGTVSKVIRECLLAALILAGTTFTIYLLLGRTIYEEVSPGERKNPGIGVIAADYSSWVKNAVTRGYLGHSQSSNREVSEIISHGFKQTFLLVIGSLLVSLCIAIPLGMYAAFRPSSIRVRSMMQTSYLVSAIPVFLFAVFIRPFWVQNFGILDWDADISVYRIIGYYGIPIVILGIADGVAGEMTKHVRESVGNILRENYIRAALARDASVLKHVFFNAVIPFATIISSRFSYALGGALIIEYIFFSQGMSVVALDALKYRDPYVLLAVGMIFSVLIVVVNLLNRFLAIAVDPRVRVGD
jgi:peptide/nickel transport system permease protein